MHRFAHPPPPPRTIGYRTVDDPWRQWGWRVALRRPAPAFSALDGAGRRGFALTGTGRATIRTPPFYRTRERLRVSERGPAAAASRRVRADRRGRLRIEVPLGAGARATTIVSIAPAGPGP
jgi:hypothetical protein